MAIRENIQVITGNRVIVEIEGHIVGMCQSVRASDNYNVVDASGIGSIQVQEYVPTKATHTLSVGLMVLYREDLAGVLSDAVGSIIENGDAALRGRVFDLRVVGHTPDTVRGLELDPQLQNRMVKKYLSCTYGSGDVSIDKHAIIMQNVQLYALNTTTQEDKSG